MRPARLACLVARPRSPAHCSVMRKGRTFTLVLEWLNLGRAMASSSFSTLASKLSVFNKASYRPNLITRKLTGSSPLLTLVAAASEVRLGPRDDS